MGYSFHLSGKIVCYPDCKRAGNAENFKDNKAKGKKFEIKARHAALIANSAANLFNMKLKSEKAMFGTVTFPIDIEEKTSNEVFKHFIKTVRRYTPIRAYIAVKELTKIGRPHFHIIFLSKFVQFTELNDYLNETFNYFSIPTSGRAFTTNSHDHRYIISDVQGAVRYVCKYISKNQQSEAFKSKCYFISKSCHFDKKPLNTLQMAFITENFPCKKVDHYDYISVMRFNPFPLDPTSYE